MKNPTSTAPRRSEPSSRETTADVLTSDGEAALLVEGDSGQETGYSVLVRGEIQASSILSDGTSTQTVTLLEDDTKLVSGSVSGGTAGFVLSGHIVAAEFDDPEPTVTVGGRVVDRDQWPTVTEYMGHGSGQEPVEDPFPNSGELGASPTDPLHPAEYVLELDASGLDGADAYCFDVDGEIIDHGDGVTVSDLGDRVYGCLQPDSAARIDVRGVITRIDTADGIDFAIRAREDEQSAA